MPQRWQHPVLTSEHPVLHAAAIRAQQIGEAHGWSPSTTRGVFDGLATVLEGRPVDERVPLSEVRSRPHRRVSRPRLAEVLTALGMLHDDTTSATQAWIDRATSDLAPGFAEPSRRWLLVLLEGDARARPRSPSTIHVYFGAVRPFLEHWATAHDHLREVTTSDIYAALKPLSAWRRKNAVTALRSLLPASSDSVWKSAPSGFIVVMRFARNTTSPLLSVVGGSVGATVDGTVTDPDGTVVRDVFGAEVVQADAAMASPTIAMVRMIFMRFPYVVR